MFSAANGGYSPQPTPAVVVAATAGRKIDHWAWSGAPNGRAYSAPAGAMLVGGTRPASPGCTTTIVKRTGAVAALA